MNLRECIARNLTSEDGLQYRFLAQEDLEEVRLLHNHPKVINQLTNTNPVSVSEQDQWFRRLSQDYSMARVVIRDANSCKLIGVFRIDKIDNVNKSVSIGLDVNANIHGQGFGKRIYVFMLDLLLIQCAVYRVYLETIATNQVARRLYESLGMTIEGNGRLALERPHGREDLIYYGLLAYEWRQRRTGESVATK
jgi:RimJ/RimL family protein N-acetyltransferase